MIHCARLDTSQAKLTKINKINGTFVPKEPDMMKRYFYFQVGTLTLATFYKFNGNWHIIWVCMYTYL